MFVQLLCLLAIGVPAVRIQFDQIRGRLGMERSEDGSSGDFGGVRLHSV